MIKIGDIKIKQNRFPDHTLLMKVNPMEVWAENKPCIVITWYYENDAELFTLICLKRHLEHSFAQTHGFALFLPYIPNARQDRVQTDEDVFTLKYFCEVINSLNFNQVIVRDAHSSVALALLNNVENLMPSNYIQKAIVFSGAEALFFPDEGAMKRYSSSVQMPYAFGVKKRDWATGEIQGLDIINSEAIAGKNILIVDDICSKGGTFFHAAKALKAAGAKSVNLYVTHCEKTIVTGELAASDDLVDHVYTTKSIFPEELFEDGYDPYWKEWITILE